MNFIGAIRHDGNFYAADGAERWFIEIRKSRADGLPYIDGDRVTIDLDVGGISYSAGIRTTTTIVYISYDLYDKDEEKVRLVDALAGFSRNEKVVLEVSGKYIEVLKYQGERSEKHFAARRKVVTQINRGLVEAEAEEESKSSFDPESVEDARSRTRRAIVNRRGQAKFRAQLLTSYGGKCAITGCDLTAALESAHIYPYKGDETNDITNGLLLRADIHTLFDLGLLVIDPETYTVILSSELKNSSYFELDNVVLSLPKKEKYWPSRDALLSHRKWAAI
jgi:hypothetical protein